MHVPLEPDLDRLIEFHVAHGQAILTHDMPQTNTVFVTNTGKPLSLQCALCSVPVQSAVLLQLCS